MTDILSATSILFILVGPPLFAIGAILYLISKDKSKEKQKNIGVKLLIAGVVLFILAIILAGIDIVLTIFGQEQGGLLV